MSRDKYVVKAQYLVRGPDGSATGHPFYFKARRGWSNEWMQVSVVEGSENPVEEFDEIGADGKPTGQKKTRNILNMINGEQLQQLQADSKNMVVRPIEMGTGEAKDANVDVPKLLAEKKELTGKVQRLEQENARLAAKLNETNALLEEATKPAKALVDKVGSRRKG
jgi:hypothetical protein